MAETVTVNRAQLDELAQALVGSTLPAADLLTGFVEALQSAVFDDEDHAITVTIHVDSVPEIFDDAFVAASPLTAAHAGGHLVVSFKIGR